MKWDTDVRYLKGVGEKRALLLHKLGIDTVGALLRFYPRAYEDWSDLRAIDDTAPGEQVCIRARLVTAVKEQYIRRNMVLYKFTVQDAAGGRMGVTLFNNRFLAERMQAGEEYLFYGRMGGGLFLPEMSSPAIASPDEAGIRPVYRATAGLSSKALSTLVRTALSAEQPDDPLPGAVRARRNLCGLREALESIHFPVSGQAFAAAKRRLVFEELFILQTALSFLKGKRRVPSGAVLPQTDLSELCSLFPFPLTCAQQRATAECLADMSCGRVMNRLLQGDVGSGKTAVAAALCRAVAQNGMQAALMAPTEILAEQHFATLSGWFQNSGVECVLLTGSMTKKQKDAAKAALSSGRAAVAVGTHALLTDDVTFSRLALVITDEQHRFGVAQRARLAAKGEHPHTLVMSATPIPRTLALIIYGDLDVSVIDEYPRGRQSIATYCVDSSYHPRVYSFIRKHLDEGRQGYIVCPLVEENETLLVKSAEEYYEELKEKAFSGYRVGLLHGKMPAREKDRVMRGFQSGEVQLLICTTVIEVGIDVPNAAVMVIENAERFGLSQLHQLRGRIGRGPHPSSCILISDRTGGATAQRLQVIKENRDGFKIADEDLKLRGPGDFLGNRQHGLPELKIADLSDDLDILRAAGKEATMILRDDPKLRAPANAALREEVTALYRRLNEN